MASTATEAPVLAFASARAWETWLAKHHADSPAVWLRIAKKGATKGSVTYSEALDAALCYGWIDSQKKPLDALAWLQKFGPRRPKGGWSRINTAKVERLTAAGRMKPAGLAEVAAAKKDGRWARAYDSPSAATVPSDFLEALAKDKKARAFFETLDKANTYAIAYRLQTAKKPETRARRMQELLAMMARSERIH